MFISHFCPHNQNISFFPNSKWWYFILRLMNVLRGMRLNASPLRGHSWFRYKNKSKSCPTCGVTENSDHFFFHCRRFRKQRTLFLEEVKPLLVTLNLPLSAATLLGFDHNLVSRTYRRKVKITREKLLTATLLFFTSTERFSLKSVNGHQSP